MASAPENCRRLLIAKGSLAPNELLDKCRRLGLEIKTVAKEELDALTKGGAHQGVCLEVGGWSYVEPDDLCKGLGAKSKLPIIIALDQVQDPGNLGAVLRTADGAGALGVVIAKDRAAALGPAASKTSAGAIASVPVARVVNMARTLDFFSEQGFWIYGFSDNAEAEIFDAKINFPCVVVLGGEHKGIRPNVLKRCHSVFSIPMRGKTSSLNVSVACGVVSYELLRRFLH